MPSRKEIILQSALKLFAEQGYRGTSTVQISQHAGVSEALIFRHYKNKEGLLSAIMDNAKEKITSIVEGFADYNSPKEKLKLVLELPFHLSPQDKEYWLLLIKVKWELNIVSADKIKPIEEMLTGIFHDLNYDEPLHEAQFLTQYIDGLIGAILRGENIEVEETKRFLHTKYHV